MTIVLVLFTLVLSFANGGNDISKGIATLVGSGVASFRRAVIWGALWTVAGGICAAFAAQKLVKTFSGSGLLTSFPEGPGFLMAVSIGAIGWILFASRTGLPVSTTHSIAGALCGAGMVADFDGVKWMSLGSSIALPLAASPLIALGLMWAVFPLVRICFAGLNRYCVCFEKHDVELQSSCSSAAMAGTAPVVVVGQTMDCAASPSVISRLNLMDSLHWASAGAASLARGMNDTPKVLALGIAASAFMGVSDSGFYIMVAVAMGIGSMVAGLLVTETLARKVTPMNPTEGFAANLITSLLVGVASRFGMPVSTTHVSSSAILAIGLHNGGKHIRWKTVADILLAWIVTLPVAAAIAALAYWLLK